MPQQRERNAIQCPSRALRTGNYRFAVRVAYDGSDYQGFQSQVSSLSSPSSISGGHDTSTTNTIQDQIELRLSNLLRRKVRILGWGRTDAGVHATGAVFTVDLSAKEVRRLSEGGPPSTFREEAGDGKGTTISKKEERKRMKKLAKMKLKEQYRQKKQQKDDGMVMKLESESEVGRKNSRNDQQHQNEADDGKEEIPSDECIQSSAKILFSTLRLFSNRPGSITAQSVTPVPTTLNFDPRFSCRWKCYAYYISHGHGNISEGGCFNPFLARYAWQIDSELDIDRIGTNDHPGKFMQAVQLLNGTHNFGWLSTVERGEERDPVRTLELDVVEIPSGIGIHQSMGAGSSEQKIKMVKISVKCDFFLYRMVRRVVGALVVVGTGQVDVAMLETCLNFHDKMREEERNKKFIIPNGLLQTAPSNGLYLEHVEYDFPI